MKRTLYGLGLSFFLVLIGCDATSVVDAPPTASAEAEVLAKTTNNNNNIDICHFLQRDGGIYQKITVALNSYPSHQLHGDAMPGEDVPGMEGYAFDENCVPVEKAVSGLVAEYDMVEGPNPNVLYDISGNGHDRALSGQTYNAEGLNFTGEPMGAGANPGAAWTIVMATDAVIDIIDSDGGTYTDLVDDVGLVPHIYTDWAESNALFGTYTYRLEYDRVLTEDERSQVDAYVRGVLEARIAGFGQDEYKRKVPNSAFRAFLASSDGGGITDLAALGSATRFKLFKSLNTDKFADWRGMRYAASATRIEPWKSNIRGTLAEISGLTNIEKFVGANNEDRLIGNLSHFASSASSLVELDLFRNSEITGELSDLASASALTMLYLGRTSVTGDLADLPPNAFVDLDLTELFSVTGDLSVLDVSSLAYLNLKAISGVTGDIQHLRGATNMKKIMLNSSGVWGDITGVIETWDENLNELSISDMGLTGAVGAGIRSTLGKMVRIHLDGNSFAVDYINDAIDACYDLRATLCAGNVRSDIQFEDQTPRAVPSPDRIDKIDELNQPGSDCVVTYDLPLTP